MYNSGDSLLTYIDFKTHKELDLCEYPDSGKVNIQPKGEVFAKGDVKEYFEGEADIREIWKKLI